MPEQATMCPKHNVLMKEFEGKFYCKDCLYSSFLTQQAQNAAVQRYNKSEKHKESEKKYEQGTGKPARDKYLHSEKYKLRRKEYNQRLAESLRIARAAHTGRAISETAAERKQQEEFTELIADIRQYADEQNRRPTPKNVAHWAKVDYNKTISQDQAATIIDRAMIRR